jgi:hypothetical protein
MLQDNGTCKVGVLLILTIRMCWKAVNDSCHGYAHCYRGMMDENNEQFVAYFVPTQETLRKRQRDTQDSVSYQEGEEYVVHDP